MNIRKMLKTAIVSVAMLATFVGTGMAAQIDVNVYGASAQFLFWNESAPGIYGAAGCTYLGRAQAGSKDIIHKGTCNSNADTLYIRVSSKASFDGIESVKGIDINADAAERCDAGEAGDPGAGLRGYYRHMAMDSGCSGFTLPPAAAGTGCTKQCNRVTLGMSDVDGASFTQSSSGNLQGPAGGAWTVRNFSGIDTTGLSSYNPVVVPFAFFANNSIRRDANYPAGTGFATINNISRMQAVMIFSGQAWNWQDFGADWDADGTVGDLDPIIACLRHAGSGTQATLDYAVMNGVWGASLASAQSAGGPDIWFNDGSSEMMNCINNNQGAIGYADADQTPPANTVRLTYNGVSASRANVRNGLYDFWTKQWAFEDPSAPNYSTTHPIILAAMNHAANPANIPVSKAAWYASVDEMWFMKSTDQLYPQYVTPTFPQLP